MSLSTPEPTDQKNPSTSSKMDYQPRKRRTEELSAWARWLARYFSRDNLIAGLRTSTWLIPMTILIWLYAEREQIYTANDCTIPIEVRSSKDRYVELKLPMNEKSVMATLSGPRGRVEEILQRIATPGESPAVVITVGQDLPPGELAQMDTAQMLASTPIFARSGVTIKGCKPAQIPVFVDEYRDIEVEVQPPPKITNLVGTPIFEPPKVKIRAPASKVPVPMPTAVFADLQSTGLLDKPGQHEAVVRVSSPLLPAEGLTYMPSTVKANFEVRQADISTQISSVVVFPLEPQNLQKQYYVQCTPTVPNVTVIGPPDQINKLSRKELQPKAILEVSRDDLPAGTPRSRPVRYEFPQELNDVHVSPEDAQRPLDFTLVDRQPE